MVQILELYMDLIKNGKEIVFVWHNSAGDAAAKDAPVGDKVELIPFSDLKSRANKYVEELWQSEWDELPGNKLHEIFPVLKHCTVCPRTNRKEKKLW